jgi:hypothetical protein
MIPVSLVTAAAGVSSHIDRADFDNICPEDPMNGRTLVGLTALGFTLLSCGGHQSVEINPKSQSLAGRWNGTLSTPSQLAGALQIRGQGWMGADEKNSDQTRAGVEIANAAPGGVHPWHVHRGQCGSDQGVFGPADAYQPLKVDNDGKASSEAELPVALPRSGSFFVNVHASKNNMGTIVACGNLAPPSH